ncbi:hypothetical protein AMATHDRAFT_138303 [Amanita thiersii Skay4041]|uniref:Thiamine pyrophosphokinase n=1 Tax=Amanita thiersii Skay4041 TaxID=703135 RepID=A0A2A9NR90_9AGAR|nr:hypothetical protein AMATHDRAFT_138303 [Amanita thiersii Skay4041]
MRKVSVWDVKFLDPCLKPSEDVRRALVIVNQSFSFSLLNRLWSCTQWHCCADGGANRLFDLLGELQANGGYLPDLIKGDLDSLRDDVRKYYVAKGVCLVRDHDQDSTDLMKCVSSLQELERREGCEYELLLLGGLSGRLDQTIHTLSYLHKLRKQRKKVFVVTDDSVGWVLDSGEHTIKIDHGLVGKTCGLLPVGVDCTVLSTSGLEWDLTDRASSFDGMISTSNHLIPGRDVWIKTTKPIWWTVEMRPQ